MVVVCEDLVEGSALGSFHLKLRKGLFIRVKVCQETGERCFALPLGGQGAHTERMS